MSDRPDDRRPGPAGGDDATILRHPRARGAVAPRDARRRSGLTRHLAEFLGEHALVLTEKASAGIQLDLYVYPPTVELPYVTVVTAGMSDVAMPMPDDDDVDRLELLIGLPAGWPGLDPWDEALLRDPRHYWPIRLLKEIARIPSQHDTYLAWGHAIDGSDGGDGRESGDGGVGALADPALTAIGLPYVGAVLGPPIGYPPELMRASTDAGPIDVLAVFPITRPELDFATGIPGGGEALTDRFLIDEVLAVLDTDRPDAASGPPPYAVHLLLADRPDTLAEAVRHALPGSAAALAENEDDEEAVLETPTGDGERVRMRLSGPLDPEPLWAQTPPEPALRAAITDHGAVLSLYPERPGDGNQVGAVFALAVTLLNGTDAAAVWLPHQRRVLGPRELLAAIDEEPILLASVYPADAPPGHAAAITRGLAALGGREVWCSVPGTDPRPAAARVWALLTESGEPEIVPGAGDQLVFDDTWYELAEDTDPVHGEPVLIMVEQARPRRAAS